MSRQDLERAAQFLDYEPKASLSMLVLRLKVDPCESLTKKPGKNRSLSVMKLTVTTDKSSQETQQTVPTRWAVMSDTRFPLPSYDGTLTKMA